jgi:DNA-directed RNA polymerase specialized sigma24 family protein
MNLPSGMNENEVVDKITAVVNRIAPKYAFYGYSVDDIKQEAFIICIEALNRYDPTRPLENFLSVNLSNRMKTFVRDNYFTANTHENRKKLVQPAQLDFEDTLIDHQGKYSISYDDLDIKEMSSVIDGSIPANMRLDYLKMLNDVYVCKQRREEIMDVIREILIERGLYVEEG